ncbi:DUF4458 domain-containing protein [Bacteroides caecicola]|uniref:DUF4458 domain-containing protein n=1 Tax=Bacteroides caecicola TaxID=1462569 RepID=UPI002012E03A|nr:DUF4458 domain-containing protein [Bacteroides caecicola]MCL1624817.1 DUF4458 domain-containing protein [Bacteroides caecicola]
MNIYKLYSKYFLSLLVSMLAMVAVTSCSDDDEDLAQSGYGYVQFKLTKSSFESAPETEEPASRTMTDKLDKLADAKKIQVVLLHDGTTVSQTLLLNSYNDENAEFGLRSDKLQLVAGAYKVVGYYLYDAVDEQLYAGGSGDNSDFTVVSGGLYVQELSVDAVSRGMVKFQLEKQVLSRATEEGYLFNAIAEIDVTVKNMFTREVTTFEKMKVTYETDYEESVGTDNPDDHYKEVGKASCDSLVWLPAGTYQVTSYTTYSRSGVSRTELETQVVKGESFVVSNNEVTENAFVPILLSETSENIKDYKALKEIWDKMGGKNWSYYGAEYPEGTNWNFNKDIDLWGEQPGVTLGNNGRVTGLVLSGFGISGFVPDAIGQLTEVQILALGSHDEKVGGKLFSSEGITVGMSEEHKQKMRHHYEEMFLKYDVRENLSEMLQDVINNDPKQSKIVKSSRISLKDTQIGGTTSRLDGISKAVMRLTKLQQLYIANAPIACVPGGVDNFCTEWEDSNSEYAKQYQQEEDEGKLSWSNMKELTDVEVYNCQNVKTLPAFLYQLPEIQLLNIACNRGIEAEQLKADWTALAKSDITGPKIQILYMGYNNLKEFPDEGADANGQGGVLTNMKKLGLLDLTDNQVEKVTAFGTDIKFATVYLQNNRITEIPENFCGFTNEMETFNFSNNLLTEVPDIFDAKSVYVMGSVDFSHNKITKVQNGSAFKGINASTVSLANNLIEEFPKELFAAGSPIQTLDISGNKLTKVPKGSLTGEKAHLLENIDLRFNRLTELSDDFRATTIPYLQGIDLSYNSFSKFPTEPLNVSQLRAIAIRHQRDDKGERCLREWPEGITTCPSLYQFQIGSNDIRKVEEVMTPYIYVLDIADNPNITIDLSGVCSAISQGLYYLFYDKTQDIRGCDILFE